MSYTFLETIDMGGQASGTFSNIPQDGSDLYMVVTGGGNNGNLAMRVNGVSSFRAYGYSGFDFNVPSNTGSHNQDANTYTLFQSVLGQVEMGVAEAYFPAYTSTSLKKAVIGYGGSSAENSNQGKIGYSAGFRNSSSAITSIEIFTSDGGTFFSGTKATLYMVQDA